MPKVKSKKREEKIEMQHDAGLAARVEKLEQEVRDLKDLLNSRNEISKPGPEDWKKTFGMFKNDPTYEEAERLGREYRRRQPKC